MVVADQGNWQADVVFVIEGTANLSPYVESLKANYIVPTLEYFNGAPVDDRDCGCDYNSTMYALVVFMAADCAPETAATCFAPTTSAHKLLSWLDKILFIGGAGESHSHIAEGLSTALQVFDDFQTLRENNLSTQKHCILICNSPPYPLPALESSAYSGMMPEQLATLMAERQISFSILSPRKIPVLFKLFEKAGGDLQLALTKNYAKDKRHLVLLKGYHLQERPVSPLLETKPNLTQPVTSVCSPTQGQKRPASSSSPNLRESSNFKQLAGQSNYSSLEWSSSESPAASLSQSQAPVTLPVPGSNSQAPVSFGQTNLGGAQTQSLPPRPGIPTPPSNHLSSLNQPNPPNVTITNKAPQPSQIPGQHQDSLRTQRGHSPIPVGGPRMAWNQTASASPPASTPPTTSVLATQLSMAPSNISIRHSAPQISQSSQPVTLPNLVSQSAVNSPQSGVNQNSGPVRPNLQNIGVRMTSASPGPTSSISGVNSAGNLAAQLNPHSTFNQQNSQQSSSISNSLTSPVMPVSIQSKLASNTTVTQLMTSQGSAITSTSNLSTTSLPSLTSLGISQNISNQSGQQSSQPHGNLVAQNERRPLWQGIIEFQEKPLPSAPTQTQRISHSLPCTFSPVSSNSGSEINAEKWPNRLVLQLLPKTMIVVSNLLNILKTAARHIIINFTQENEALQKLCKTMSSNCVGLIQFPQSCDIRIMVVLYMPEKKVYMGSIANDQDSFLNSVRQMFDNHRKNQQQKQRLQQLSGNSPSEGLSLATSTASNPGIMISQPGVSSSIVGSSNPIGTRLPLGQQQLNQNISQLPQSAVSNANIVHSTNTSQQQQQQQQSTLAQQQATNARLSQLEAERHQNLVKIQQLQQTLEAAQQKELQYKAAQEQQQQQQQQAMVDRQNAIRQLHQQLQQQQQQQQHLQQQQQRIQMQQLSQNSHNPQLRTLLQQTRQQQHPMLMQQHPQNIRMQISNNLTPSGIVSSVASQSQQQPSQQQQSWSDSGILDLLPP